MHRMSSHDRYQLDPIFRSIVDTLQYMLVSSDDHGKQFTATEVREAAMLACEMYEYTHIRPMLILKSDPGRLDLFGGEPHTGGEPRTTSGK